MIVLNCYYPFYYYIDYSYQNGCFFMFMNMNIMFIIL